MLSRDFKSKRFWFEASISLLPFVRALNRSKRNGPSFVSTLNNLMNSFSWHAPIYTLSPRPCVCVGWFCLCVSVFACVSVTVFECVCLSLCNCVWLSVFICVSVGGCESFSLCVWACLYVCLLVRRWVCVSVCVSPSVCMSAQSGWLKNNLKKPTLFFI